MIFPLDKPCPGNRLVIAMLRSEFRLSEYVLSDLQCLRRFAFLSAIGFPGLALKITGKHFCLDEMRMFCELVLSCSDSGSDSEEFCLSVCSWLIVSLTS